MAARHLRQARRRRRCSTFSRGARLARQGCDGAPLQDAFPGSIIACRRKKTATHFFGRRRAYTEGRSERHHTSRRTSRSDPAEARRRQGRQSRMRSPQSEDWPAFWRLLSAHLEARFGVAPVHSLDEIERLHRRFPDNIKLFVGTRGSEMLAGTVIYESRIVAHVQYIASSEAGRQSGALDKLFLDLLAGYFRDKPFFDFGISNTDHRPESTRPDRAEGRLWRPRRGPRLLSRGTLMAADGLGRGTTGRGIARGPGRAFRRRRHPQYDFDVPALRRCFWLSPIRSRTHFPTSPAWR